MLLYSLLLWCYGLDAKYQGNSNENWRMKWNERKKLMQEKTVFIKWFSARELNEQKLRASAKFTSEPHEMRTRNTGNRRQEDVWIKWREKKRSSTDARIWKQWTWDGKRETLKKLFWLVFSAKRCIRGEQNFHTVIV